MKTMIRNAPRRTACFVFPALLAALLASAAPVAAAPVANHPLATVTVRSSADAGGTCPGATCTLRAAIAAAASGDTIDFDMATVTSPITLASELAIDKSLTIQGPGASLLTLSGNNAVRVLHIGGVTPAITVTLSGLTIAHGRHRGADGASPADGFGGGILNSSTGTLTIGNAVISGNSAIGGNNVNGNFNGGAHGLGGGIYHANTGTLSIASSIISGNTARGGNGNLGTGEDGSKVGGNATGGGIFNSGGTVNFTNSMLTGNSVSDGDTIMSGDGLGAHIFGIASKGGGLSNGPAGSASITNSTVSSNSASGGLVSMTSGSLALHITIIGGEGGGVFNDGGIVRVTNSSFFGNSANGITIGGSGGATHVTPLSSYGGGILNGGQLTLTNSTFAGNAANGTPSFNGGPSSTGNGGGIENFSGATVLAKNSLVATNTADVGPDFDGTLTSQGWNLIGNNQDATITPSPGTADQIGTPATPIDPLLGPLADNGGPTLTMAPLKGSPALDKGAAAIDPISGLAISTDQRNLARPFDDPLNPNAADGDGSDIGAFEAQTSVPVELLRFVVE